MEFGIGNDLESTRVMTPREDGFAQTVEKNKYRLFLAEMFGMMTFVGLSLSNVAVYSLFPSNMSWEGVAIAWGFNLLLGIKVAKYGNAYLNPCIAACDYILAGNISMCEFFIYFFAEMLGAFIGATISYGLHYKLYPENICGFFGTSPAEGITYTQAFFVELLGTMLFSFCIFKILNSKMPGAEYAIAFSLSAVVMSIGYQTAFSYNWARDFGPRVFSSFLDSSCMNDYTAIPFTADFFGAALGWVLAHL